MNPELSFTIRHYWWAWEDPVIVDAVNIPIAWRLIDAVNRALVARREADRFPSYWAHFTALRRDEKNVRLMGTGSKIPSLGFLGSVAHMLDVPAAEILSPPLRVLVAGATVCLATWDRQRGYRSEGLNEVEAFALAVSESDVVTLEVALNYADSVLSVPPRTHKKTAPKSGELDAWLQHLGAHRQALVRDVAAHIGPHLVARDKAMEDVAQKRNPVTDERPEEVESW